MECLDDAIEALEGGEIKKAGVYLEQTLELVSDVSYGDLTLRQAASAACVASDVVDMIDATRATNSGDLNAHSRGIMADDATWQAANGDGRVEDLVPMLAMTYNYHGVTLGRPVETSPELVLELVSRGVPIADLPGLIMTAWAAGTGKLGELAEAIDTRLASLTPFHCAADDDSCAIPVAA